MAISISIFLDVAIQCQLQWGFTECQIQTEVHRRTTAIKILGGKVRFTGQNGHSDNSKAKLNEVPISSETNDNIHALSNHAKICSP